MQYIVYCDESEDKGEFYSSFYGGALIEARKRQAIEAHLAATGIGRQGEAKWTKIGPHNEVLYISFVDAIFDLVAKGDLKMRMMFTQNINVVDHLAYEEETRYFKLYYQFLKHAFGLMYCNDDRRNPVNISVYLDDAPDTAEKLDNFKNYIAGLTNLPDFYLAGVVFSKKDISEVNSKQHLILQAVDVVLGSMQSRLNEVHLRVPLGAHVRGKRTRAKEKVYNHINKRIQAIYPRFNIGRSTGHQNGPSDRWTHPYRHWCFVPDGSVYDPSRGKQKKRRAPPRPT